MKNHTLRIGISTSLALASTLALGLSSVACSGSNDDPGAASAGARSEATGGASSASGGASSAYGGASSAYGGATSTSGGASSTSGGASSASGGASSTCVPETLTVPSDTPAILQPRSGATLIHHFHAAGTQDYTCMATAGAGDAGATYAWVFTAPETVLSDNCGNHVGTHFAGSGGAATPRWQYTADGSFVQGVKVEASPVAGAIPELLLAATETTPGTFADVTYVQRLATVGGAAPDAAACTSGNVDVVRKSGYSAEYYFYAGGADAGAH